MNRIVLVSSFFLALPFANSCNKNVYNIKINGTHIASYSLSEDRATRGKDFTVKFTPEKYYRLYPESILEVSVKGREHYEGEGWEFSSDTSTLKVKGEIVTGDVNIKVEAGIFPFYINVYTNDWRTDKDDRIEKGGYYVAEVDQNFSTCLLTVEDPDFNLSYVEEASTLNCRVVEQGNNRLFYVDKTEFYRDFDIRFKKK